MAAQRFFPDDERTRLAFGWTFAAIGAVLCAGVVWLAVTAGRVNVTTVVLFAVPAGLAAIGLRLALRLPVVLEVDPDARTFTVVRDGKPGRARPLDELGPLTVVRRTRRTGSGKNRRTVTEYVVIGATDPRIDLYVTSSSPRARRKMEKLGRAWGLPCQSLGGEVRGPHDLDKPLHERARMLQLDPMPLRPEWGVRIEPLSAGYALISRHRAWAPLAHGAILLVVLLFAVNFGGHTSLRSMLAAADADLMTRVLGGLMVFIALALTWNFAMGARDTFFPGTVRITERGVSYRWRRMAFERIEEVTGDTPVQLVGDRRVLSLATTFCPPAATGAVAHELQRLILEVAPRGPALRL